MPVISEENIRKPMRVIYYCSTEGDTDSGNYIWLDGDMGRYT